MIRNLDLRGQRPTAAELRRMVPRAALDIRQAAAQIEPLIQDIRVHGVSAVHEVSQKFDGFRAEPLWVGQHEINAALATLDADLEQSILTSIARVCKASQESMPSDGRTKFAEGAVVGHRWVPVDSVGLYVPGGKAVYPSSVVMNVIPAQVAGVRRIVIATPGQKEFGGRPHPSVLATAGLLGVNEILVIGGPAAIAAMAYGLEEIKFEPVDLITGPGNIFVAAAKRLVRGDVGIDSEAGTTEILVLADETADARLIAFDLISQAEHDAAAAAVLVTNSQKLVNDVAWHLEQLAPLAAHADRVIAALSANQSALVLVDDIEFAIEFANAYATEHLEVMTSDDASVVNQITNAGAIFVGAYSPVSLGDYMAGSNHVLPTGSTARFSSGLNVTTFMRSQQVIAYDALGLSQIADLIDGFAIAEGLPAHGQAVQARFPSK